MYKKVKESRRISQIDKGSLKRILNVGDLFAVGYGDLGSSIYYALGITALYSLGATPISLALAGFIFACTALAYAELSSMLRDSGGSAAFTRHAFNDLISFIAGWALLLDFIVTIAISTYSIAPYLSFFFMQLKFPLFKVIFTIFIIVILFIINFFGSKGSARLSWFLTGLTLSTQIIIIFIGAIWLMKTPDVFYHLRIGVKNVSWSPSWDQFWRGTAMAMVAYTGIESMAQLGGEAKTPARTVPKAMMLAMGMLLVVYIGISLVALSVLSPQELSSKYLEDPLAGIVSVLPFGGRVLGGWIGLLAAVILFVAGNAGLIGASRLSFNMGRNYQIPRAIYRLHPKYKSPYISLAVFAALSICIVIASRGKLTFLADLYNFGAMLAFFMTHLSLIILRIRKPNQRRPFKCPLNISFKGISFPLISLIGGLATFATWILVLITKPDGRYLGTIWLILGLVMYIFYRKKQAIRPTTTVKIEKVKIPDFHPLKYKKIVVPTRGGQETGTVQMACEIARIHGAKVTALHVMEVPFSLSLESSLNERTALAESILSRADAIGREFHIGMHLRMIIARSIDSAILNLVDYEKFDLIVMGTQISKGGTSKGYGGVVEKVLKKAPCPVWLCFCAPKKFQSLVEPSYTKLQ